MPTPQAVLFGGSSQHSTNAGTLDIKQVLLGDCWILDLEKAKRTKNDPSIWRPIARQDADHLAYGPYGGDMEKIRDCYESQGRINGINS